MVVRGRRGEMEYKASYTPFLQYSILVPRFCPEQPTNALTGGYGMPEYTTLRNINRGYMKLEVWQKAVELFKLVWDAVHSEVKIDLKLRSQIVDAAQSVSSNVAEGYSRRSIKEYIQFLYVALGSLSEVMTRAIGLRVTGQISEVQSHRIDALHYEVENKLLRLIESLENKREVGGWADRISEDMEEYLP